MLDALVRHALRPAGRAGLALALALSAAGQLPIAPSPRGADATLEWVARFDHGIQGHDSGSAVTVDSQGNVLAAGSSLGHYGSAYIYDTTTCKYAPDGTLLWERRYHGPGSGFNSGAVAVASDASDGVWVLANDPGSSGNQDIVVIEYDAAGTQQWLYRFDNNWSEGGVGIVVDAQGDAYVAGSSYYPGNVTDIVLLKLDPLGTLQWETHWHGGFGTDWPVGLALDPHGNVDVVGNTIGPGSGTDFDWVVLEYDPAGALAWSATLAGALQWPDYSIGMAVAPNGDVCATGYLVQTPSNQHHTTARWSDGGTLRWSHTFAGASGGGRSVAFDAAGRTYVAGQAGLVAYDAAGGLRWQRAFTLSGATWTSPLAAAALPPGRIAVVGSGHYAGTGDHFGLELFDLAGDALDELVVDAPHLGAPQGWWAGGARLVLHGSGSNGHDQDMLTVAISVQ